HFQPFSRSPLSPERPGRHLSKRVSGLSVFSANTVVILLSFCALILGESIISLYFSQVYDSFSTAMHPPLNIAALSFLCWQGHGLDSGRNVWHGFRRVLH